MSGGTFYEMDTETWFFLPDDGSTGSFIFSDEPEDIVFDDVKPPGYEPEPDGIDWSAALDAYFKDKGM